MSRINETVNRLTNWYFSRRALPHWVIFIIDCLVVICSGLLSHALCIGFVETVQEFWRLFAANAVYLIFYVIGFRLLHTYSGVLRYSSFVDLIRISCANMFGAACVFLLMVVARLDMHLIPVEWEELVCTLLIATGLMWGLRIAMKYLHDLYLVSSNSEGVFIYGVKEGGVALAKSIRSQASGVEVKGFVSDEPSDSKHYLMGTKIYMNDAELIPTMKEHGVRVLMVSPLKTDALRENQALIDALTAAGIKIKMYTEQEWDGKSDLRHTQLKDVDVEDLLPRNQIDVDLDAIKSVLHGKCVMITGAAGSIGSEIVRQVASFGPSQLVLVDQAETPLHEIRMMMAKKFPEIPALTLTASIGHRRHMEKVFADYRPEYLFHAAAYKHVPMMEDNPGEAVVNNVDGTRIIADLAVKYGVKKFVMVSTDKAVNPTNVMGCSKRICEMYCQLLDKAIKEGRVEGCTQFVTTRFGNVLGSNGSVIPIFKEQLKLGGPITVTHPEIIRFFMLIPEACKLVLQAGTMGHGSEIFVFDMGKPVKIADLARRMIQLSGATNVKIEFTGLRDGEKLYEEVLKSDENTVPSSHPKIRVAQVRELAYEEVNSQIDELVSVTINGYDDMDIVRKMKELVPEFKSKHSKYEALD